MRIIWPTIGSMNHRTVQQLVHQVLCILFSLVSIPEVYASLIIQFWLAGKRLILDDRKKKSEEKKKIPCPSKIEIPVSYNLVTAMHYKCQNYFSELKLSVKFNRCIWQMYQLNWVFFFQIVALSKVPSIYRARFN